jgi:ADP-heptose:LPS heptosyltransferase
MWYESILVYISSDVDNALGENIIKLPMILALADSFPGATRHPILKRRFDLVIDTQRYLGRTLFMRRIPHKRFISGTWRYFFSDRKPPAGVSVRPPLLVDKLLGLVAAAAERPVAVHNPIPVPDAWLRHAREILPGGPCYVGLAPGVGNMASKRDWPLDNFIALARVQIRRGRVPVMILGPGEKQWESTISNAVPGALIPNLADVPAGSVGGPTLTVALAGRLSAAVANDAGAGHLLASGGAPMVSLFGWSRPEKRAPFSRTVEIVASKDYGSDSVTDIPLAVVIDAVDRQVVIGPLRRD